MYFMLRYLTAHDGFSANQKDVKIQILTQASPTIDNGINGFSHPVPQKYVCHDPITVFLP